MEPDADPSRDGIDADPETTADHLMGPDVSEAPVPAPVTGAANTTAPEPFDVSVDDLDPDERATLVEHLDVEHLDVEHLDAESVGLVEPGDPEMARARQILASTPAIVDAPERQPLSKRTVVILASIVAVAFGLPLIYVAFADTAETVSSAGDTAAYENLDAYADHLRGAGSISSDEASTIFESSFRTPVPGGAVVVARSDGQVCWSVVVTGAGLPESEDPIQSEPRYCETP